MHRGRRWLRGHDSNAVLRGQIPAWSLVHHLAWVWTAGFEPATPGFRCRCAPVAPRPAARTAPGWRCSLGTDGRIRTDTDGGLSAVPLPVGLRQREDPHVGVGSVVARAGVEPAGGAHEAPRIPDLSRWGGDGPCPGTGRTKGATRPGRPRRRRRIPRPAHRAGVWCGRRESNPHPPRGGRRSCAVGRRPRELPEEGSNLHRPGNNRLSCPLDDLASVPRRGVEPRSPG